MKYYEMKDGVFSFWKACQPIARDKVVFRVPEGDHPLIWAEKNIHLFDPTGGVQEASDADIICWMNTHSDHEMKDLREVVFQYEKPEPIEKPPTICGLKFIEDFKNVADKTVMFDDLVDMMTEAELIRVRAHPTTERGIWAVQFDIKWEAKN